MALKPARLQWAGTGDGGLRSLDFGDIYFQSGCGREESHYVFLEQNRLPARFAKADDFRIAELGFGTGLNFLLTAELWDKTAPSSARLTYVSIEKHPVLLSDLNCLYAQWPDLQKYAAPLLAQYPPLIEGFHHLHLLGGRVRLILLFGDVADVLPELSGVFDAWYRDGFAPAKNPAMWDEKLFPLVAVRTRAGGTLATFSAAGAVRRGLQAAGFDVEKAPGFGVKRDMTVARMAGAALPASRKKIAVLGAGIAGASAAYALAQRGHEVMVLDRQPEAAAETSGNPVGIVYPKLTRSASPMGLFHQHGFCFTRNLAEALRLPSWNACGVTHLDISDEDRDRHRAFSEQGYPDDFLKYDNGLQLPMAGYLSPPEFCRALLDHPKIKTVFAMPVDYLEDFNADAVVIALGHGSRNFAETAWLPLQSLWGQISYLKPTAASAAITRVLCHDGYITPAVAGVHYIGATFHKEEPSVPELRVADHRENLEKLNRHVPGLGFSEASVIGGRAGYRTTTPDRLPMIGACPDYNAFLAATPRAIDRLYLSTGFGAHGMTGAPLAGEMIAAEISGGISPIPGSLAPYLAPERFILRDLKRGKI